MEKHPGLLGDESPPDAEYNVETPHFAGLKTGLIVRCG
jgi:hypothetical protein